MWRPPSVCGEISARTQGVYHYFLLTQHPDCLGFNSSWFFICTSPFDIYYLCWELAVKVAAVKKKITEKRIKWFGHVKKRDEGHVLRRMLDAPVQRKRRRGRQKTRWEDSFKMESVALKEEDVLDRRKRKI